MVGGDGKAEGFRLVMELSDHDGARRQKNVEEGECNKSASKGAKGQLEAVKCIEIFGSGDLAMDSTGQFRRNSREEQNEGAKCGGALTPPATSRSALDDSTRERLS